MNSLLLRYTTIACLLWIPSITHAESLIKVIEPGVSPQLIKLSQEEVEKSKVRLNTLLTQSNLTLLFEAEKIIQLATLLEPSLLIAHYELPIDFPNYSPPTKTIIRLKPHKAVEYVFQELQDVLCEQNHENPFTSSPNDVITNWIPIATTAVPSALTTASSIRLAKDISTIIVGLFLKADSEACQLDSPYDGVF